MQCEVLITIHEDRVTQYAWETWQLAQVNRTDFSLLLLLCDLNKAKKWPSSRGSDKWLSKLFKYSYEHKCALIIVAEKVSYVLF